MAAVRYEISKLILTPALITLIVTLLRLTGELAGWSSTFFDKEPGGGNAVVGIVWLIPVFSIYFAWQLAAAGQIEASGFRIIGFSILGLAILILVYGVASSLFGPYSPATMVLSALGAIVATFTVRPGSFRLFSVLASYALAARIPISIVMFFAIHGEWGTHYDLMPAEFPEMGSFATWVFAGLLPQMTIWIAFTVSLGGIFSGLTLLFVKRLVQSLVSGNFQQSYPERKAREELDS